MSMTHAILCIGVVHGMLLVSEMSHACKNHSHVAFICGFDDFFITH
jgi:hypothetical protein